MAFTKETAEEPKISLHFCHDKFVRRENRVQELKQFAPPGMKEIKQVELYPKLRKFVPAEFADEICPKPPDEILENVHRERSAQNRERNAKKRTKAIAVGEGRGRSRGRGRGAEAEHHARRISFLS